MSTIDVNPVDLKNPVDLTNPVDLNVADPGIEVEGGAHSQHGYSPNRDAYLRRLKRIEGQVRGIARMVEEDKYCIDILTQVSAVTKALHAVSLGLVEEHIGHCVVGAASEPDPAVRAEQIDIKVKEAADAIGRLLR
jgi:DNA-binding FrmR family transcriptional regulator